MAAHDWELVRDAGLWCRYLEEAIRINDGLMIAHCDYMYRAHQDRLSAFKARCSHVPNPERPERCYKCGDESRAVPVASLRKCVPSIQRARRAG